MYRYVHYLHTLYLKKIKLIHNKSYSYIRIIINSLLILLIHRDINIIEIKMLIKALKMTV